MDYTILPTKVRATFAADFRLLAITLLQDKDFDGTFTEETYNVSTTNGDYGEMQTEIKAPTSRTPGLSDLTKIKLEFSEPIDPLYVERSFNITENWLNIYKLGTMSGPPSPTSYSLSNGNRDVLLYFPRMTPLQDFRFSINDRLQNNSGEPLSNPRSFRGQTIMPNVAWEVDRVYVHYGNDLCVLCGSDAGLYLKTVTAFNRGNPDTENCPEGSTQLDNGRVCLASKIVGDGSDFDDARHYDETLLAQPRVGRYSSFHTLVEAMDQDDNVWADVIAGLGYTLTVVGALIGGHGVENGGYTSPVAAAGGFTMVMGAMLVLMAEGGIFNGSDDSFGSNTWDASRENWWGCHPSFEAQRTKKFTDDGGNVDVTFGQYFY